MGLSTNISAGVPPHKKSNLKRLLVEKKRRKLEERLRYYEPTSALRTDRIPGGENPQDEFHNSTDDERWIFGGNRSGKTEAGVADCLWLCLGQHPIRSEHQVPPVKIRYCAPQWRETIVDVVLKKFKEMTPHNTLRGGSWDKAWSEALHTLTFKNGSEIKFKSFEEKLNTFGGANLDAVYQDEHGPESYYKENRARLVDRDGYFVSTMTPEEGVTWEEDNVEDPPEGLTVDHWFFWTQKNPYLSKEGIRKFAAAIKDPILREAKMKGLFVPLTGRVIASYNKNISIIPDRPLHPNAYRVFCIDLHTKTPSAAMWAAWEPSKGREGFELVVYRTAKMAYTVPQWKQFIQAQTGAEKIGYWFGDESERETGVKNIYDKDSIIAEFNKESDDCSIVIPIQPVSKGPGSFDAGIFKLRDMFMPDLTGRPRVFIFESCNYGIAHINGKACGSLPWELKRYSYKKERKADEESLREKVRKINDHLIDDLRYISMAGPMHVGTSPDFGIGVYGG